MKIKHFRFLSLFFFILGMFFLLNSKTDVIGAVIGVSTIPPVFSSLFGIVSLLISAILFVSGTSLEERIRKTRYGPQLSPELRACLESKGKLQEFLNDYRQMCNNFKPAKIYIPEKERKPKKYEELSDAEKEELKKLGRGYAFALHQLLEAGLKLAKENNNYAVIGGLGVLCHLYEHNSRFPLKFRGTEDIDILSSKDEEEKVKPREYTALGFSESPPERIDRSTIPDRRLDTFIKSNPYTDRQLKIQQRYSISFGQRRDVDEARDVLKHKKRIKLYGVPIWVASDEDIIQTKTGIRRRKDKLGGFKDLHDIEHLTSIQKLRSRRKQ
mgnify:CR=1 FL=1